MFHEQYIGHHENMLMLRLFNWKLIERTPSHLGECSYSYTIQISRMRGSTAEHAELKVLPQISLRIVTSLSNSLRKGSRGQLLEQVAALFRLGLGVPRLATIAQYLETYNPEDDKDSSTIEAICDLIDAHVSKLRIATEDFGYIPYAKYIDHTYNFAKVVSKDAQGEIVRTRNAPEGVPVVLIYRLKSSEDGNFVLAGGFRFTESGFPVNFDHIVCRVGFKAAPKKFKSTSLKSNCNYVLVTGILQMTGREYTMDHLRELGHHTEDVLLADSNNVKSKQHREELAAMELLRTQISKAKFFIDHYEGSVVPKSKRQTHKRALEFLASDQVIKHQRQSERLEGKIVRDLQTAGPVTRCKFYALDLGLIKNSVDFQHVKAKLAKVEEVLKHFGFELSSEQKATRKIRLHITKQKTRVWSI